MGMSKELLIPEHIALIMDGNRRWAKEKGFDPKYGHKVGAETIEKIVKYANKIGIKYLTVYAFSTENWKREQDEVNALMKLLELYVKKMIKNLKDEVRVNIIGDTSRLSSGIQKLINELMEKTKKNKGLTFNIAFGYGGRNEIINGIKKLACEIKKGEIDIDNINEEMFSNYLYTAGQPDPDLLIRTSGEMRTSNFLPWQLVYSEFLFIEKNWPDFSEEDLDEAIKIYNKRTRKFGAN